ncbi:response regulator [Niabella drilacis]|uniref:Two component transcriptional regulator, LuxR family n=1 Tax=Niabella drilacis (strain DSM 25811 / CCM 8410 / CCUG 62505 / LMG 26954 / E90) TaxID=1285928 RepID=A0A1G6J3P6_NIADE|nr:response regulator transcription factor [Niabella drilacis]SDC13351.1 two component transcriptional regulator, LuxR family [Niabella drilacis]
MLISVIIIEDDVHYNNALKKIIDHDPELFCIAQCFNGAEAIEQLTVLNADVAIVDIRLADITGTQVLQSLSGKKLHTQFIMCTSFENDEHIYEALKAGATGYLLKGESMEKIIAAVKEVHLGGVPMTATVSRKILQYFSANRDTRNTVAELLTETETEVLHLLAKGLLYKEIASEKFVSIDTIKKHISNIYRKLQVNNKVEAINKLLSSN